MMKKAGVIPKNHARFLYFSVPVQNQAEPGDHVPPGLEVDTEPLHGVGEEHAVALHAGEHPVRMAAGPLRIRTLFADGAGLGGQGVGLRPLVPEEAVDLPGDLLMVRPGLQGPLQIRDVRHLAHGGQQQGPGVGQAPGPALLHRAHGGGTGPAGPVAGAVRLTDHPDPGGKRQLRRIKKLILHHRQLSQPLFQPVSVHIRRFPSPLFSPSIPHFPAQGKIESGLCQIFLANRRTSGII